MKEVKIERCPYCGDVDFTKGYRRQGIFPSAKVKTLQEASTLEFTVCKECGSVIHIQVMDMHYLK